MDLRLLWAPVALERYDTAYNGDQFTSNFDPEVPLDIFNII
jgi:hypothetical protein